MHFQDPPNRSVAALVVNLQSRINPFVTIGCLPCVVAFLSLCVLFNVYFVWINDYLSLTIIITGSQYTSKKDLKLSIPISDD